MKNKFKGLFALAILIATAFLLGCNCDKTKLVNTWELEKYGPESTLKTASKPGILLTLDNANHFSGNDGCNSIFGSYKAEEGCKIKFDSIKTTLIFCTDSIIRQQADAITAILQKANAFKVTDTQLEICAPDKEILKYKKK